MSDLAPTYRCPTCQSALVNPRNLAVFIDGTSNKPGDEETNVMKLYHLASEQEGLSDVKQLTFYLEGVGVYDVNHLPWLSRALKGGYSKLEEAFAWNVAKNVVEAYRWPARNYQKGDQMYLFGFSRGAYQVRALAGMIHEVGLVKGPSQKRFERAYRRYHSFDHNDPQKAEAARQFKRAFCWADVRIHFVGVWDTVSSLGLIKKDVHLTASSSETNACHFRHALALDERRVKFMPEYFGEMNAYHCKVKCPGFSKDVQEVWFAGYHSDVGGTSRPCTEFVHNLVGDKHNSAHADHVALLWMRKEAVDAGLVLKPGEIAWCPDDIRHGRKDMMDWFYKILEHLPIRHQVAFSGIGRHEWRRHRFHPRVVIPGQRIHFSISSSNAYEPYATLAGRVDIPTAQREATDELRTTDPSDEESTTRLLASLLSDQRRTLETLSRVLFLLDHRLVNNHTQAIPNMEWSDISIHDQPGYNKFALTVIYDVISGFSASQEIVGDAKRSLETILHPQHRLQISRSLHVLRFAARYPKLRQRFITEEEVNKVLVPVLDWTAMICSEDLFPMVIDTLRYLLDDDDRRDNIINQLKSRLYGTGAEQTRLMFILELKVFLNHAPSYLIAALQMIRSLAQQCPGHHEDLRPRIIELAKEEGSSVGTAAVQALVALNVPLACYVNVRFSNILGYLSGTLPLLDAEGGCTSPPDVAVALPPIFQVNSSGVLDDQHMVICKLVQAISSCDAHERTVATLVLLKLFKYAEFQVFCSQNREKVLEVLLKQLDQSQTSLLAAYALNTCLKLGMWEAGDFERAERRVLNMLDKGWFDDAVGRVEGTQIFRDLMTSDDLRQRIIRLGAVTTLEKKLEVGDRHLTRVSLICLDILWGENPAELARKVTDSLTLLKDPDVNKRKKGIRTVSSPALTVVGAQALEPHVFEIVKLLLPSDGSLASRSQLFGASAALHNLCRNENLRQIIKKSNEYGKFKDCREDGTLYPQTR